MLLFSAGARTVITADEGVRGGKKIQLKKTVDEAVAQCPEVSTVFVAQRTGADVPMHPTRDIFLDRVGFIASFIVVILGLSLLGTS